MSTVQEKRNYTLPIIVMFFLFAMISFVTGFQNPFGVILKEQFHLSNLESQLGNAANFIAYAFMGIPAGLILQKKGYRYSAIAAVLVGLVGVLLMFVSSMLETGVFAVYLMGAFVAGFSMCMLNTVVNPMLNTLGGGGKKGNQLIQFGGATNSLAATICPVLVGYLMGDTMKGLTLEAARPALYIAMGIFALAFVVLLLSKLPEPILEEAAKGEKSKAEKVSVKGALKYRHFALGVVAIFLYVGIEVGIPNMANLYMTTQTQASAQATVDEYNKQQSDPLYLASLQAADAQNAEQMKAYQHDKGLFTPAEVEKLVNYENKVISLSQYEVASEIVSGVKSPGEGMNPSAAGTLIGMYWLLMLVGRLIGGSIGAKVSSKVQLMVVSALAILFVLISMYVPDKTIPIPGFQNMSFTLIDAPISILFFILCGLCTSVMWGGIFNLAVEGLGKYTAVASGFFMVMVCGGGILPLVQSGIADVAGFLSSYWVIIVALAYILLYALVGSTPKKVEE
ncbi:MFS transporter [Barnesiella sp. An55]|uniref:MFS transporter n=1 Tax=Barnesiella sp. An55 TaxID=1965646 RepID=UPI000B3A3819|nr:MFS transporter [Barnesiella sp. An55]HIZ25947.1 MFS transporter [Candidatus Barnesiella merdipullorum]